MGCQMRRFAVTVVAAVLAGCSMPPATSTLRPTQSPADSPNTSAQPSPQVARVVAGGCGSTPLLAGGIPGWLDEAGAHNNPLGVTYAVASPTTAAGFLFGYPLTAGNRLNPSNKILWVVGLPRNGSPLDIKGHPLNAL